MAGPNPLVNLGTLNRVLGTLLFNDFPSLNITAPYLTREAIRLAIEGDTTDMLPAMTSMVQSQNVYLKATISVGLVKTTPLVPLFKAKMESDSNLGSISFRSDTKNIPSYDFANCAIEGFEGLDASGTNIAYPLRISGTYYVNSNLFSLHL
jgi:hypothetical protein